MVEQGIYQMVVQSSTVQEATGGTTRAFWILAPQGTVIPFLVFSRVATSDTYTMAGTTGLRDGLFQIVAYASDYLTSRRIADAVRELLQNFKGPLPDADVTNVQSIWIEKDFDQSYQSGGKGFVHGAYLQFRVWYVD